MESLKEAFLRIMKESECMVYDSQQSFRVDIKGDHGMWPGFAFFIEEERFFLFYSLLMTPVPKERILEVAELLTRLNHKMKTGAFELDMESGELSYRTSVTILTDGPEKDELIKRAVWGNAATMDAHYRTIMKVIYSRTAPKDALGTDETLVQ